MMMMEKKGKGPEKYEIECWADAILKAEEIKADPKKMALVKPVLEQRAKGMKKAIESLSDLRAVAKSKMEDESSEVDAPEKSPEDMKEDKAEGETD